MSAKLTKFTVSNESIEWNVISLIRSQNNHRVWSKVKAHLKDASVPFPSECLLLKECFSLSNDVLQYVSKSSQIVCTVLTPEFMPQTIC